MPAANSVNQFRVAPAWLGHIGLMDAASAYQFGQAITDSRQAARKLWKVMLSHGRSSAWFVLGYWRHANPTEKDVEQIFAAIQEQKAQLDYEGFRQSADDTWLEWLLYVPVSESRREVTIQ